VKRTLFLLAIALFLAGCQQPADVELQTEVGVAELEVVPVVRPDTLIVTSAVDTTAILPADQISYVGQFAVNRVTLDAGAGKVDSFAYSRVLVSDSTVWYFLRRVGINGVDLGTVLLNGTPMVKIAHQISVVSLIARDTVLTRGVEYRADLSRTYQPLIPYTWSAPTASTGALSVRILAPGSLEVLSPAGGGIYSRDNDMLLRWNGSGGKLEIIVSIVEPLRKKSIPILELRPRVNTGKALLRASVLAQFPRTSFYVFTFVLSNRTEMVSVQAQTGKVLVQAAEIYNSYIELR
jgi:hypothetical protein